MSLMGNTLSASPDGRDLSDKLKENFDIANEITTLGKELYKKGWLYGTSGNLSAVVSKNPFTLAITPSGLDKGNLNPNQIIHVNSEGEVIFGIYKPSSETPIHLILAKEMSAGAILHTHSVWSTVLSKSKPLTDSIELNGFEMLKGLSNVTTHLHKEIIPILENSQDMIQVSLEVSNLLQNNRNIHGFILRGHGLYTWGKDLNEAKRHLEVLEYLMEVLFRIREYSI
jgi:methylthioribulose-1-phosphate dehydratase